MTLIIKTTPATVANMMISNKPGRQFGGVLNNLKKFAAAGSCVPSSSSSSRSVVTFASPGITGGAAGAVAAETDHHHHNLRKIFPPTRGTAYVATTTKSHYSTSSPTQQQREKQHHHQLNINHAVKKSDEGHYFHDLVDSSVSTLQGIGPKHLEQLETLGLKTIHQLGQYKYFQLARAIQTLATAEEPGRRSESSTMNINKGLDKAYEHLSLKEMLDLPVHAIQGITETKSNEIWTAGLGVKTIGDLAEFKYCKWAEAVVVASKFEEKK
mmetsp:Transcript_21083/g.50114  ORF Transcript_21083/g.50114 Transcript_21083/m.50114 type:complete len:269 (+) Transcript_21083:1-807(+)